jgi:hypothetical protein
VAFVYRLLPLSFEDLKISSGFVLYETTVGFMTSDPTLLSAEGLRDRAYVYVDRVRHFKFHYFSCLQ